MTKRNAVVATLVAMFVLYLSLGTVWAENFDLNRTLRELDEALPPGEVVLVSERDEDWQWHLYGHSRYQYLATEGQSARAHWAEQALGTNAQLGKRLKLAGLFVGNDPYGGGNPMLRWAYLQAKLYGPLHLRIGQQPIPFGYDQTFYGPADWNLPVVRRPVDLATAADKAIALDSEVSFLGKPGHGWFYIRQGRGPNQNDNNEPFRDYGGRLLVQTGNRLDLGVSAQVGKRLQAWHAGVPASASQGDLNAFQRMLGADFRFWPQGRSGKLRWEGEWLWQHRDIPWGRDRILRQGHLRSIYAWRSGVEVVVQARYNDPDDMSPRPGLGKEQVGFSVGLNLYRLADRQRLQLAYEARDQEADQLTLVYQLRF